MRILGSLALLMFFAQAVILVAEAFIHPEMTHTEFLLTYWVGYLKLLLLIIAVHLCFKEKK